MEKKLNHYYFDKLRNLKEKFDFFEIIQKMNKGMNFYQESLKNIKVMIEDAPTVLPSASLKSAIETLKLNFDDSLKLKDL